MDRKTYRPSLDLTGFILFYCEVVDASLAISAQQVDGTADGVTNIIASSKGTWRREYFSLNGVSSCILNEKAGDSRRFTSSRKQERYVQSTTKASK